MHGIHHQLQSGIDNGPGLFRVEPFDERGRAFEVGKQRRDGFAFTVRGAAGLPRFLFRANPFGQMRGGVAELLRVGF
jgi:hypothetical protein